MTEQAGKETKSERDARFAEEMAETLDGMHATGVIDTANYKLTMRELNRDGLPPDIPPVTGPDIRAMREQAQLSQAVFARYLRLTVDHVSKLERGTRHPTGPALVLLNVIRRKGIGVIL